MMTPETRPDVTAQNTPQLIQSVVASRAKATRIRIELPKVPRNKARSRFFWVASSLQRTRKIPTMDRIMPMAETRRGASTALMGCIPLASTAEAGRAAPRAAVARIEPQ